MEKLNSLVAVLSGAKAVAPERIEALIESGQTTWSGRMMGADLLLFRVTYTAVVELFGISGSLTHLLALVTLWLADQDPEFNRLASFEGEPVDDKRSDVSVRLELEEAVHYVPAKPDNSTADQIFWGGITWKPGSKEASRASSLEDLTILVPA